MSTLSLERPVGVMNITMMSEREFSTYGTSHQISRVGYSLSATSAMIILQKGVSLDRKCGSWLSTNRYR